MDDSEQFITLDRALLHAILRRRARAAAIVGAAGWVLLLVLCLLLVPRSYRASASLALQQNSGAGGALAGLSVLAGGGGTAKNYSGVTGSRRFAAEAARAASIRSLYDLPSEEAAISLVRKGVSLDDRKDGLVYLNVRLPGPPRLASGAAREQERVKQAAVRVTETYVLSLQRYLATTNTNRDAALIREARNQLQAARSEYDRSVRQLSAFARGSTALVAATPALAAAPGEAPGTSKAAGRSGRELEELYLRRGELLAEIRGAEAARAATVGLLSRSASSLAALPDEDPLLAESRRQVRLAQEKVNTLRIDLADENPEVVAAREQLRVAQNRLENERRTALRQGNSSGRTALDVLKAKLDTTTRQIAAAERGFHAGRQAATTWEQLQGEVALRLEVLKATASQYAALSVQTVAGDGLMEVIDAPQAARRGTPGLMVLGAASLFGVLLLLGVWIGAEYLYRSTRVATSHPVEEAIVDNAPVLVQAPRNGIRQE